MNQSLALSIEIEIQAVMPAVVATGLMQSLVTIQMPDGNETADGSPSGDFVNVIGLIDIQCMDAPMSVIQPSVTENKAMAQVESDATRHVLLDSYYDDILNGQGWRAVVDGVVYDLLGTESDSQRSQTRLNLRRVLL